MSELINNSEKSLSIDNANNNDNMLHLKVRDIREETAGAGTIYFSENNGKEISFTPGQFLTFPLLIDGVEKRKSYSICTSPAELPLIGITIKKTNDGYSSNYILDNLTPGDILTAYPPMGEFTVHLDPGTSRELVLVGAGSGITPLMSILKAALYVEKESTVKLYYGNRDEGSIIFRSQLEDLEKFYGRRLKIVHFLSAPKETLNENQINQRITRSSFKRRLQSDGFGPDAQFYICGPEGMMTGVINALRDLGVNSSRIHTEYFKITISQDPYINEENIKTRHVTVIFEGKEHIITVKPYDSILQSALEQGLELPNSCQMGQCSSCRARLISGKINLVEQTALADWEINEGYCLTCVGYPMSDDVVVDYDATARF